MYQQTQQQRQAPQLSEEDMLMNLITELKRSIREYSTAATESNCQNVRQMFTDLLNTSLNMQGKLYNVMSQQQYYSPSSPVLRQEIDKQLKEYQQTDQKTRQFVQQNIGIPVATTAPYANANTVNPYINQPQQFM